MRTRTMKSAEYETIDAGKIQATKGTILSCIIDANANMSDTQSNNMYLTINEQKDNGQKTEPNCDPTIS